MPIRRPSDDEESFPDTSMETLHGRLGLQSLHRTKLLTQVLLLLTGSAFIANLYFLLRTSRTVNLEDGLYTNLVSSSKGNEQ
jgi:hypothetical protein